MRLMPLIAVTVLYAIQVVVLLCLRQWASALIFAGYAVANVGLIAQL